MKINYVILAVGILTAILSLFYVRMISSSLKIDYEGFFGFHLLKDLPLVLETGQAKGMLYLLVAVIINIGLSLALFLKLNITLWSRKFLFSTLLLVFLMVIILGLLSSLTLYVSFINPLILLITYFVGIKHIYKIDILGSMTVVVLLQIFLLGVAIIFGNIQEFIFSYLDLIWFLCITVLLPLFSNKIDPSYPNRNVGH